MGRRWAEVDARDGSRIEPEHLDTRTDTVRAWALGARRGYRDTWARIDAGTLRPSMFELGPVNR